MERQWTDLPVRGRGDSLNPDTPVHEPVIVHNVVVDHRRVVINLRHLPRRQTMMRIIVIVEVMQRNERKVFRPQAEIEVEPDVHPVETIACVEIEIGMRR